MKREQIKKLIELRREAIPLFREIRKLTEKAGRIMQDIDGDWAHDYIWNGMNLRWILRMIKLEKEKNFKKLGKEIQKKADKFLKKDKRKGSK